MNLGRLVFSQITDFIPFHSLRRCIAKYNGNYYVKDFSCIDQYLCMLFAQITGRESLRETVVCLNSHKQKLWHLGIRGNVAKSTLADANERRDWQIYRDFAMKLISIARPLYQNDEFVIELENAVYALDSSVIDLCISNFYWAKFRKSKGGIKLHTLLDLRGNIPVFIDISEAKVNDMNSLDLFEIEVDSFYIMDRGYLDFERLYMINQAGAFFVIRPRSNTKMQRIYSNPVDKSTGVKCDQIVKLTGVDTPKKYPEKLRRVKYYDEETDKTFVFINPNYG